MLSKMSKKNIDFIRETLYHAQRTKDFIMKDETKVCTKSYGTTTIEYKNNKGEYITEINKNYGSNLTGIDFVINNLKDLLKTEQE